MRSTVTDPSTDPDTLPEGPSARTLEPVPGRYVDPPDIDTATVRWVVDRYDALAWLWRWWERFRDGYGTLSAKGIAFYGFFSFLSALALVYGFLFTAVPGSRDLIEDFLYDAFPGVIGADGIDVDALAASAGTISAVGAAVLLYSALAVVRAIDSGVRLVYGVQYNPRGLVVKSLRQLGWVLVLVPLLVLSYASTTVVTGVFTGFFEAIGWEPGEALSTLVPVAAGFASLVFNLALFWTLLTVFTGVRPSPRARVWGTIVGAVAFEAVKVGATFLFGFVLTNPRYSFFAAPIAILLLFFAMAVVLLAAAALVATVAEGDAVARARRRQPIPQETPLDHATAALANARSTAETITDRLS
jgi:uncharacterized BrkB/YihY/UPF0761 family membrane protein